MSLLIPFFVGCMSFFYYESRFKLVFKANSISEDTEGDSGFAFFNGSEWVITHEGDATLQVVDVTGRVLVSGNAINRISTNDLAPGVYVLRLIDGENVKAQKIVVR